MEDNKTQVPKTEYVPMAHKLDIPQELNLHLRDTAEQIGKLSDNKKRLDTIADLLHGLSEYRINFDIGMQQVDGVKQSKSTIKGKFSKRAVKFLPHYGPKLVRDNLSQTFIKDDQQEHFLELLNQKIFEEVKKLTEASARAEKVEELADVYEVLDTFIKVYGIDKGKLESKVDLLNKNGSKKRTSRRKLSWI